MKKRPRLPNFNPRLRKAMTLLSFFLIVSCGSKIATENSTGNVVTIDIDEKLQIVGAADIDSIPLKTGGYGPIGMIYKFVAYHDNCFILDIITNSIWKFDSKGNLSGYIHNVGNGPGEYLMPMDIDIDKEGMLYLLDMRKSSIIRYTSDSLKYVSEIKLPDRAQAFCALDSTTFYLHKANEGRKVLIDLGIYRRGADKIEPIFKYNDKLEYMANGMNNTNLWRSGDSILYYRRFTSDIYLLEDSVVNYAQLDTKCLPSEEQIREYIEMGPAAEGYRVSQKDNTLSNVNFIYNDGNGLMCGIATAPPKYLYTDLSSRDNYEFQFGEPFHGINIGAIGVWNNRFVCVREAQDDDNPSLILYSINQ